MWSIVDIVEHALMASVTVINTSNKVKTDARMPVVLTSNITELDSGHLITRHAYHRDALCRTYPSTRLSLRLSLR